MSTPFFDVPDVRGPGPEMDQLAARFGINADDILAGALRGGRGIPTTRARLSHAYTLRTRTGHIIGAAFRADVHQAREIEFEFEIDANARGEPAELVPQIMTAQTFRLARIDLYDEIMEEVFGPDFEIVRLTDQRAGLRLREVWRAPTSFLNSRGRQYEYGSCFFADLGREVGADGDRVVRVNAEFVWLTRSKIA